MGKVYLEVAFGTMENFRSEILPFEVVDLKSPYHALFGRPAMRSSWPDHAMFT